MSHLLRHPERFSGCKDCWSTTCWMHCCDAGSTAGSWVQLHPRCLDLQAVYTVDLGCLHCISCLQVAPRRQHLWLRALDSGHCKALCL